jgi:two-component system response regulator MprA
MKILLVDDNEELREFMAHSLSEAGIEAVTAANASEALIKAAADRFDVLVVDSFLGEDDGLDLVARLVASKSGKNTPILLMSTISTALARRIASAAGCSEFLVKPFGLTQFAELVRSMARTRK